MATRRCCLPLKTTASAPRRGDFAAQYPACPFPCQRFTSALAVPRRMTRGRRSWLFLHRTELASALPHRFYPGARFRPFQALVGKALGCWSAFPTRGRARLEAGTAPRILAHEAPGGSVNATGVPSARERHRAVPICGARAVLDAETAPDAERSRHRGLKGRKSSLSRPASRRPPGAAAPEEKRGNASRRAGKVSGVPSERISTTDSSARIGLPLREQVT